MNLKRHLLLPLWFGWTGIFYRSNAKTNQILFWRLDNKIELGWSSSLPATFGSSWWTDNHFGYSCSYLAEKYLESWLNTLLVVSYDKAFLDNVRTDILQMHNENLDAYRLIGCILRIFPCSHIWGSVNSSQLTPKMTFTIW